ncbi:MAG: SGNH/GDSL hydrolase family protein [Clostridia bacterium]|nr:SGNH/GDSL hydrolase family protein [Clostridia bacterium]
MKTAKRITVLLLAVIMMIPMTAFWVSADIILYGEQDFEGLTEGNSLALNDGFAAVPTYSAIRADADGNRFVHVPFVGSYTAKANSPTGSEICEGNCDKSIQVNHESLDDGYDFVIEVDYRPHYNGSKNVTVEAQFRRYSFVTENGEEKKEAGQYFNLYKINLEDGSITNCGEVVDGAVGMKLNEWNTLKMVFHPSNGHFEIYVNGALYARQENPKFQINNGSWITYYNCSDVKIGANNFIAAKCNKVSEAYTSKDLGEDTNYIDVDNIRIYEAATANVTINGKQRLIGQSGRIDVSEAGKKLVYAKITLPDGTSYFTGDTVIETVDGMVIETRTIALDSYSMEARTCTPLGIRFVTAVDPADYLALKADENVKGIRWGTLITAADTLDAVDVFTHEALDGAVTFRDVEVRLGNWYGEDILEDQYLFAGSIVNIREENYNRAFAGVGYMEVTLQDGSVYTVYAESDKEDVLTGSVSECAIIKMRDKNLNAAEEKVMQAFADAFEGGEDAFYEKDLRGLNVLAIGDSLFYGAKETIGEKQWINLLGNKYGWNLTNLGIGGATISYNPAITSNVSMYDRLFNTATYKFGSRADSRYYNCGNPSGNAEDVDMILLQGGSNDYGPKVSAPVGEVGSTDPKDFLGAWKLMVDKLLADYPNATVVMMTAWENNNQNREDKANAIEFTSSVVDLYEALYAENERVKLIDSGSPDVSGVDMRNSTFRAKYAYDAFHLNDDGMKLMAESMTPLLWDIVTDNSVKKEKRAVMVEQMNGMDVLAIGASSFDGDYLYSYQTWLALLAKECGWNLTNLGQDGWTLAHNDDVYQYSEDVRPSMYDHLVNDENYRFATSAYAYYNYGDVTGKSREDVDLILLQGGTNDYSWNIPYGELSDRTETTYLGALNLMIDELTEQYPNAKIVLVTHWHNTGERRMNYTVNGMKQVVATNYADNDRVMVLDLGAKEISGVDMTDGVFREKYGKDVSDINHLNELGMQLVAENVLDDFWKLVVKGKNASARERMAGEMEELNVLTIGDSLFHGDFLEDHQTWIALLAQECGWNLTNLGRDGWTVAYNPDAYADPSKVRTSMYNKLMNDASYKYGSSSYYNYGNTADKSAEDVDLILLEGGTNDFGWGIPIGSVSDRTERTYMGAVNLMIEELLVRYPNARIVLVTSWHSTNETRMAFVANGMKEIKAVNYADNDRVTVLDAGAVNVSGVDMTSKNFLSSYAKNGTDINHLNAEGMKLVAENLLAEIWKLVK